MDPLLHAAFSAESAKLKKYIASKSSWQEAEDLMQELYLQLSLYELRNPVRQPLAILYVVAARLVFRHWRRRNTERHRLSRLEEEETAAWEAIPERSWGDPEQLVTRAELQKISDTLTPRQQNVVALHSRGYSYDEIAEKLKVSSHCVKRDFAQALLIFRNDLGKIGRGR